VFYIYLPFFGSRMAMIYISGSIAVLRMHLFIDDSQIYRRVH